MIDNRISEKFRVALRTVKDSKRGYEQGSLDDAPGSGWPRSVRTFKNVSTVSQAIKDNPRQSSGNCQKLSIRSMTYKT